MPHLLKIAHEWPDTRKELPKLGNFAKTIHMPLRPDPIRTANERHRPLGAPAQLEAEATTGLAQRLARRRIGGNELVGPAGIL
jgi:hypothetical protein